MASVVLLGIAGVAAMFDSGPALSAQAGRETRKPRSMLLVSATPTRLVHNTMDRVPAPGGPSEFLMFQKMQVELLKSRSVLSKALSHPDVAKLPSVVRRRDPIGWLADDLTLTFVGELLYIGLEGDNEQEAVKLVNAVTDAYLEEVVNADKNRRKQRLNHLQVILRKTKEDMRVHQENLKALAERAGLEGNDSVTLSLRRQMLLRELSNGARESLRVKLEKGEAEALLEVKKAAKDGGDDARKAIAALEERLTVLAKQERLLAEDKSRLYAESHSLDLAAMDKEASRDHIHPSEEIARLVGAEVEALKLELEAPNRVQLVERAMATTRP